MMTDEEYFSWFSERLDMFEPIGIVHPRSAWGRIFKVVAEISMLEQEELKKKIKSLEDKIKKIEKSTGTPVPAPIVEKKKRKARKKV